MNAPVLTHSQERYLRTIYALSAVKSQVYQRDVVQELGCSKPSVSRAVAPLRKKGLLEPNRRELVLTAEAQTLEQRLERVRAQVKAARGQTELPSEAMKAGMEELFARQAILRWK